MGDQRLEVYLSILALELTQQANARGFLFNTFQAPGALWIQFGHEPTQFQGSGMVNRLVYETQKLPEEAAEEFVDYLEDQVELYSLVT